MVEKCEHKAYDLLKKEYKRVALDYVIFSTNEEYDGVETHKKAVIEAFNILNKRLVAKRLVAKMLVASAHCVYIETDKMIATKIEINEFLKLPLDNYYDSRPEGDRCFCIPTPLPYWFAFLEPPYGTPYLKSDFIKFNDILFPNKADVEVYRWNDDFSNYFDDGKEWWGTGLWTAFDVRNRVMVVIGASQTD